MGYSQLPQVCMLSNHCPAVFRRTERQLHLCGRTTGKQSDVNLSAEGLDCRSLCLLRPQPNVIMPENCLALLFQVTQVLGWKSSSCWERALVDCEMNGITSSTGSSFQNSEWSVDIVFLKLHRAKQGSVTFGKIHNELWKQFTSFRAVLIIHMVRNLLDFFFFSNSV